MRNALVLALSFAAACSSSSPSSTGGTGGTGGSGSNNAAQCSEASRFAGAPISAPTNTWTFIPIDGSVCRDGSPTGIGVHLDPAADKLLIYLEGGGACFNLASCYSNPASFGESDFASIKSRATGVFDLANAKNPFAGFSVVYVPYCTGDVHAGNNPSGEVPSGPSGQAFVGYANVTRALERLVPTLPHLSQVVLSGASAGGFGASFNYHQVAQAFCPTPVTLLDDSGPPLGDAWMAPCLQQRWRDLWKLGDTVPAACTACTGPDGGGLVHYAEWLAQTYPAAHFGLISSVTDNVIPRFYGYGANDCAALDGVMGSETPQEFMMGLEALRADVLDKVPAWSTYFITSSQHTWIGSPSVYTQTSGGQVLVDWIGKLVAGEASGPVGP